MKFPLSRTKLLIWAQKPSEADAYFHLFHRGLGLIYLCALLPLFYEIRGLIGAIGLLPAEELLKMAYADQGILRSIIQFPSLFHFYPNDITLLALVTLGCFGAIMLVINFKPFIAAILSWISFLSLTTIGGDFLVIIIDLFLAEVGFLALFSTYFIQHRGYIPNLVRFSMVLLNFRLWFCMGINKFYMPLDVWTDLVFFDYFFQAQPMPTPLAYYFNLAPSYLKFFGEAFMFVGEVLIPFAVFGGKRLRMLAFTTFIAISVLIQLNGNYGYFNVLSIVVAFTIFKEHDVRPISSWFQTNLVVNQGIPRMVKAVLAIQISLQLIYCVTIFDPSPYSHQNHFNVIFNSENTNSKLMNALNEPLRYLGYWRICSPYGVFKGIPNYHGEIRFSGSADGEIWEDYEFRFLPSANTDQISFFAPYYPRLDHLMFYETLSESNHKHNPLNRYNDYENAWTCNFIRSLFTNNPEVTKLLELNPFQGSNPKYVRTQVYRLSFDYDSENYWKAENMGFERIYTNDTCSAPLISYEEAMRTVSNAVQ